MQESGSPPDGSTTRLKRILRSHPEARGRLGEAVGGLLAVVLVAVAALTALAIWHLRRRADLVRSRLDGVRLDRPPESPEPPTPAAQTPTPTPTPQKDAPSDDPGPALPPS